MLLKSFPATLAGIAQDQGIGRDAIEVWFADEARIGQKNKITRRWVRRGNAARQRHSDQRYSPPPTSFGADLSERRHRRSALILPKCNTARRCNLHLDRDQRKDVHAGTPRRASARSRPDGTPPAKLDGARKTSRSCRCRPNAPNSTRSWRMSGSSCATTGSPTGCSATTTTSPATAAITGTGSSLRPGASCPSACAIGHIGSDQRELV